MAVKELDTLTVGYRTGNSVFQKERPTLVMIHGAGGNSEFWSLQLTPLGREINTFALDLPGHGQSEGKSCDTISGYAQWVYDVVEKWFKEPVYLMGNSMGGAIVQEIAIQHNERFKGFILVGTSATLKVTPQFLEGLSQDFEKTVDTIASYAYSRNTDKGLILEGARIMKKPGQDAVFNDFLACDRFDRGQDLKKISAPCLIICGADEKLTPPAFSRFLHEQIPDSRLKIIPAAGHMVMIERYQEVNAAVLEFIKERE